jgi:hypothetical protein
MFRRRAITSLYKQARFAFSTNNTEGSYKKPDQVPEYDRVEFEPFKFNHEKHQVFSGYTMEELFGARYDRKVPDEVRRQQGFDTFMILLTIGLSLYLVAQSRNTWMVDDEYFKSYLYHDMNYRRAVNPEERRVQDIVDSALANDKAYQFIKRSK